jgi:hypothetical protein
MSLVIFQQCFNSYLYYCDTNYNVIDLQLQCSLAWIHIICTIYNVCNIMSSFFLYLQNTLDLAMDNNTKLSFLSTNIDKMKDDFGKRPVAQVNPINVAGITELKNFMRFNDPSPEVDTFFGCIELQDIMAQYYCDQIAMDNLEGNELKPNISLSVVVVQYCLLTSFTSYFLAHSVWGDDLK